MWNSRFDQVHKSIGGYKFSWTEVGYQKTHIIICKVKLPVWEKNVPRFIEKVQILKLHFSFHWLYSVNIQRNLDLSSQLNKFSNDLDMN